MSLIRTILVAGVDGKSDNIGLRYAEENFLKAVHVPEISRVNPIIPVLDAAMLFASNSSHLLNDKVFDVYRGRHLFLIRGGISSIREEFEEKMYGKGVLQKLRSDDLNKHLKIAYLLGRFFSKGDTFVIKEFGPKVKKLLGMDFENSVSGPLLTNLKNKGVLKGEGHGLYVFQGLTEKIYDQLLEKGIFLEKDAALIKKVESTEILVRKAYVPPMLANVTPMFPVKEEDEEALPEEQKMLTFDAGQPKEEQALVPIEKSRSDAAEELLIDALADIQFRLEKIETIIKAVPPAPILHNVPIDVESIVAAMSTRVETIFDKRESVHSRLFELADKLKGMDADQLDRFNELLAMFHRIKETAK